MSVEVKNISEPHLRFKNDQSLSFNESMKQIQNESTESVQSYSKRVSSVISKRLAHIAWKEHDPRLYNQIVPWWDNYILFAIGNYLGVKEYERYHFTNYVRTFERGIGICGDASMVMSQILEESGVENEIIAFPGHVIVEVSSPDGKVHIHDPDFGVSIPFTIDQIKNNPSIVDDYYDKLKFSEKERSSLKNIYSGNYTRWTGVSHFVTKKYYFEILAYWLKWIIPIFLSAMSIYLVRKKRV